MFLDVGFKEISTTTDYDTAYANACFSTIDSAVTCKTLISADPG